MKKLVIISFLFILPLMVLACQQKPKETGDLSFKNYGKTTSNTNDEQDFYRVLKLFKKEINLRNNSALIKLMHFPFYTSQQQLPNGESGIISDPIELNEFEAFKSSIYNKDVVKLLPKASDSELSEIDEKTDEPYYQSIKKLTDKGSKLYELYIQYPQSNSQAETYFAFVFGKINGKYKALAYYAKWPVK